MSNRVRSIEELENLGDEVLLRKSEIALLAGLRPSTIKFYSEAGLLPCDEGGDRLNRRFRKGPAMQRLIEIKHLKDARLTLQEIQERLK